MLIYMKNIQRIIYKKFYKKDKKNLHSFLMKNKYYFRYFHICANYGGIRKYIQSLEIDLYYYKHNREKWHRDNYYNLNKKLEQIQKNKH